MATVVISRAVVLATAPITRTLSDSIGPTDTLSGDDTLPTIVILKAGVAAEEVEDPVLATIVISGVQVGAQESESSTISRTLTDSLPILDQGIPQALEYEYAFTDALGSTDTLTALKYQAGKREYWNGSAWAVLLKRQWDGDSWVEID